jgi:hypothetical protein
MGGLGSTLSDKLQRLQINRASRIITKCGYDVRSCVLLQHLNLNNLETRRNEQLATLMFKVRNSMAPHYQIYFKEPMTYTFTKRDRCKIIFHLNQTLISRKNHLVTGVRWLGIVYLVILKDHKLSNLSKISFNWNESNHNFLL